MSGDRGRRRRIAKGIYEDRYAKVARVQRNGQVVERHYPRDTATATIQNWRDETRARLGHAPVTSHGTLADDAVRYLAIVRPTLISYQDRAYHIAEWVRVFGTLRTSELPRYVGKLNEQLGRWRTTLAASSCNHRRDAIMNLTLVLYGKRAWRELSDDLIRFRPPPPVAGSNPAGRTISFRVHSGDIGNTFGLNGFAMGSSRHVSWSKYPRS